MFLGASFEHEGQRNVSRLVGVGSGCKSLELRAGNRAPQYLHMLAALLIVSVQ